jgi:hypothetical protein
MANGRPTAARQLDSPFRLLVDYGHVELTMRNHRRPFLRSALRRLRIVACAKASRHTKRKQNTPNTASCKPAPISACSGYCGVYFAAWILVANNLPALLE